MKDSPLLVRLSPAKADALRSHCTGWMETARSYRLSFWAHWAQLAEMFLPRRYKWFVTPNQYNRGSPLNQSIVDETQVIAARTLASGLLSGLTSPTKPWFRLAVRGYESVETGNIRTWAAECETRMMRVFSESNFYQSLGVAYHDLGVFGSAAIIAYEDFEDCVRFYNPCLGEFFFICDNRLTVTGLFREFTYTLNQLVSEFGKANLPPELQNAITSGGGSKETEFVVCHGILKNDEIQYKGQSWGTAVPPKFPYMEVYWLQGSNSQTLLRVQPFREKPFVGARWDVTSNDPYGRSPGMDALPAARQLQIEQRRKAEAIDKMVRPPMVGSASMKNEPANILPGGITYVANPSGEGFKPAFQVEPRISEMTEDIKEVQGRINSVFFVDLFLMISNLDTVRTATEIDARREEKLIQLGPVIERFENEVLDPIIERVFNIMLRKGLLPPAPAEIQGKPISVQYVSMLAEAQRAASTAAIERLLQIAGNLVGVVPDIMDNIDTDETIEEYATLLAVPPKLLRDLAAVQKIRASRNAQLQQQQQLQTGQALSQGAANLSKANVGGGKNALEAMLNG